MTGRRPIPVNVDLSTTQDPHHGERGIPAYARDFALAFDRVADLSAVEPLWVVDDAYPVPAALAPLAEAGRLVPLSEVAAHRPPLFTHLMSPMYGPGGRLDTKRWLDAHPVPVAMTVYDLVPYLMPDDYLGETSARARFHASLEWVKHADLLLAISEHTRADFIEHLAIPADRVVAVGTGVPARFSPAPDRAAAIRAAVESVPGLRAGFAMYTGGSDARKNVEGLLAAWALVDPALRARHQLAVVFKLHGTHGEHLARVAEELGVADDVVFTGFVDDDVLLAMYRSTDLFVFPSLYEGFGLPVAEALACGAVSIASDTSSLPEVLPDPDARFDPKDPTAIAAAITRGLTESAFRERALRTAQAVDHSWEGVVAATERAYGSLAARLR